MIVAFWDKTSLGLLLEGDDLLDERLCGGVAVHELQLLLQGGRLLGELLDPVREPLLVLLEKRGLLLEGSVLGEMRFCLALEDLIRLHGLELRREGLPELAVLGHLADLLLEELVLLELLLDDLVPVVELLPEVRDLLLVLDLGDQRLRGPLEEVDLLLRLSVLRA